MTFKQIDYHEKFSKDLKKLLKKFPTLEGDLNSLIKAQLVAYHKHGVDNYGIIPVEGLGIVRPNIYKVKKFACKSLKGKGVHSGMRITYAYFSIEDRIEFIEIYYKGDKDNEDRERIKQLYAR